jgi:hypothetical protein
VDRKLIFKIIFWVSLSVFLSLGVISVYSIGFCAGADITLAWDEPGPGVDGYRVYQREHGADYDYNAPVFDDKETTCNIENLEPGKTYYFVVRSYLGANSSGNSNEVAYTVPGDEPADPDGDDGDVTAPVGLVVCGHQVIDSLKAEIDSIRLRIDRIIDHFEIEMDDLVFCGNPASMVLHEFGHWCGENAVRFDRIEDAEAAGYLKCKVCKPGE